MREGRFFFRHDIWQQLLHDVVDRLLQSLDGYDFSELLLHFDYVVLDVFFSRGLFVLPWNSA